MQLTVEQPGANDSNAGHAINLVVLCGHNDQVRDELERLSGHQRSGVLILGCCNLDRSSLSRLLANFTSVVCSAGEPRAVDAVPLVSDICSNFLNRKFSISQSVMHAKNALAANRADVESYGFYCRGLDATLFEQAEGVDETDTLRSARAFLTYIDDDERLGKNKNRKSEDRVGPSYYTHLYKHLGIHGGQGSPGTFMGKFNGFEAALELWKIAYLNGVDVGQAAKLACFDVNVGKDNNKKTTWVFIEDVPESTGFHGRPLEETEVRRRCKQYGIDFREVPVIPLPE